MVSEWDEGSGKSEQKGYVARDVGAEVREGKSRDDAAKGVTGVQRKVHGLHSVRILRVQVVRLLVKLAIKNDGATLHTETMVTMRSSRRAYPKSSTSVQTCHTPCRE